MRTVVPCFLASLIWLCFGPQAVAAGGMDGGGGKGVLCGKTLTTLDLYEMESRGRLTLPAGESVDSVIGEVSKTLLNYFSDSDVSGKSWATQAMVLLRREVIESFSDIAAGQRLTATDDATVPPLPNGCAPVQIALYSSDGHIYRDHEYWKMLNPVNQAALIMHEWIYHRAKQTDRNLNSDETRKVVGAIVYHDAVAPVVSPVWGASRSLWCGGGIRGSAQEVFEFFGVTETENGQTGVAVYFYTLKNFLVTGQTRAFLGGVELSSLIGGPLIVKDVTATDRVTGHSWRLELIKDTTGRSLIRAIDGSEAPAFSNFFCHLN